MSYTTTAPAVISRPRAIDSESARGLLNPQLAQPQHASAQVASRRSLASECMPRASPRDGTRLRQRAAMFEAPAARSSYPTPSRVDYWSKSVPRPDCDSARARTESEPARAPPPQPSPRGRKLDARPLPTQQCTDEGLLLPRVPLEPIKTQPFGPIDTSTEFGALLASYAEQLRGTPLEVDASVVFV